MRCEGITKAGERCRLEATHASYCYQHAPETADERHRRASKGGRAGGNDRGRASGNSEVSALKGQLQEIADGVLDGDVPRERATVAVQALNALARVLELERRWLETDELEEKLRALEDRLGLRGNERAS
jgi:hypothetical protein